MQGAPTTSGEGDGGGRLVGLGSGTGSHWYRDEAVLLAELQRGQAAGGGVPIVPGYDGLRELRRGGQGVVYTATQRSTKRKVAIKVLLEGSLASKATRRRFEREVDLAASLRHPNIVRVYDSGVTEAGWPYLVMEFVEGQPLDDWLRSRRDATELDAGEIADRLGVFVLVADAVNAAHLRGVIHRDLKPSNIRVDSEGQPRILDFGLAKALGPSHTGDGPTVSRTGQFLGSLPWASPEQAEGDQARIDVRTDIYSLGVILYQMVTGKFPYPVDGTVSQALESVLRAEPVSPRSIQRAIDEDLQTVVLRCLAKERERRYQTAGELAQDIRNVLAGEPIQARRDSGWYTLRKTMRRYQLAAVAAGVVVVVTAAALAVSIRSWQGAVRSRDEARRQASQRAAINAYLERMLLSADPSRDGRDAKVVDVLASAAAEADTAFKGEPLTEAAARSTLAQTYAALGLYDEAVTHGRRALELRRGLLGEDQADTLETMAALAPVLARQGKNDEAEAMARDAAERSVRVLGAEHPQTLRTRSRLGETLAECGKHKEAEPVLRETADAQKRTLGEASDDTITTLNTLGIVLKYAGKFAEAETIFRTALAATIARSGELHPTAMAAANNLALTLDQQGKFKEAEELFRKQLTIKEKVLGPEHPDSVATLSNLGTMLIEAGRLDEAETVLRRVSTAQVNQHGLEHPMTQIAQNNLAKVLQDQGKLAEAEPLFRQVWEIRKRTLGPEHPYTLLSGGNLATLLSMLGREEDGLAISQQVLEARQRTLGESHLDTMISTNNVARTLQRMGRIPESVDLFAGLVKSAAASLPEGNYMRALFQGNYGRALMAAERWSEADKQLTASYGTLRATFGDADKRTKVAIQNLIDICGKTGQGERAEALKRALAPP